MPVIMRSDFPALMVEGTRVLFNEAYEEGPKEFEQLYTMANSEREFEVSMGMVGLGGRIPRKPEGEPIRYRQPQQGRPVVFVHQTFSLGVAISLEAKEDDRSGMIARLMIPELARTMAVTREIDGVDLLNNGFTLMGYEPDGVSLFSTAHPLIGGGTFSNRSATDAALSITSLQTARAQGRRVLTESGRRFPVVFDTLYVPPELESLAEELVTSANKPTGGALQGERNVMQNKFKVVVLNYLTDVNAWFLGSPQGRRNFIWYNRVLPQFKSWDDLDADILKSKTRARWSRGFTDPRGWYASQGPA